MGEHRTAADLTLTSDRYAGHTPRESALARDLADLSAGQASAALTPIRPRRTLPNVGELVDLPDARSRWFADERGRSLRATWHPEAGLVVLSLWQADRCIGTFRVSGDDAAALGALLAGASVMDASGEVAR